MKKDTKNVVNPNEAANREAARAARQAAQDTAIAKFADMLQTHSDAMRIHAYLLAPHVDYEYSYQMLDADGNTSTKEGIGDTMYPLLDVLGTMPVAESEEVSRVNQMRRAVAHLAGGLEMLYSARAANKPDADTEQQTRTECKRRLADVYSLLEGQDISGDTPKKIIYNANHAELETIYIMAFRESGKKTDRKLLTKNTESLIKAIVYCLWSKLVGKGYTLGMASKPVPAKVEKLIPAPKVKATPKAEKVA